VLSCALVPLSFVIAGPYMLLLGSYALIGPPLRIDQAPLPYPMPAPVLGADTRTVLFEAGFGASEIDSLVSQGIAVEP